MKYSFTENYYDIRKFEEFDKALEDIESKIKYDPEQFSEKSYNKLKENIQKLRDWAREYLEQEYVDDKDSDENGECYGLSCIDFKSSYTLTGREPFNNGRIPRLEGRIEIGPKFKEKNNIESCHSYAEFRVSPYSFEIAVEGNVYKIYE